MLAFRCAIPNVPFLVGVCALQARTVKDSHATLWHTDALDSRPQTEKFPTMASLYRTWRHLVLGWLACTQCRNPLLVVFLNALHHHRYNLLC